MNSQPSSHAMRFIRTAALAAAAAAGGAAAYACADTLARAAALLYVAGWPS